MDLTTFTKGDYTLNVLIYAIQVVDLKMILFTDCLFDGVGRFACDEP